MMTRLLIAIAALLCLAAATPDEAINTVTDKERQDGWQLLFDGKSTKGWMTIQGEPLPDRYVQEGALNPHPCDYMLTSGAAYTNYVLSLDFKITPRCNSGVFVRTFPLKPRPGQSIGYNGIEVAIDDTKSADYHDTGAIYDLVKPTKNAMKPVGEWNRMVITSDNNLLLVELNGQQVTRMNLDEFVQPGKRPDGSAHKFADIAYKDHPRQGYLGLQDHGSDCWYRNIKLKRLP
jgi:hypothetical protein